MAEAIAALSLVSSIATLVDLSFKIVSRVKEFTSKSADVPQSISALSNRLPLLIRHIRLIDENAKSGRVKDEVAQDLIRLVEDLVLQVDYVKQQLDKLTPSSCSVWDRTVKGVKSLIKDEKLTQVLIKIHQSIDILLLHQTTSTEAAVNALRADIGVVAANGPTSIPCPGFGLCLQAAPLIEYDAFIGRMEELQELDHLLEPNSTSKGQKVVSIVGTGGIGKTQLGLQYARQYAASYSSIFWLDAQTESGLRQGVATLCSIVFQGTQYQGADEENVRVEKMKQWLSESWNTQWLLIFDNYDDPDLPGLRSASGYDVRSFFPMSSSHGKILITTRSPKLIFTQQLQLSKFQDLAQSLAVLAHRSGRDTASEPGARDLAIRLDGLPLALATAGHYLRETPISCAEYLELYEDEWLELTGPDSDELYEYADRRLSSTWALSLRQVQCQDDDAAELLRFLAYFNNQDIWFELLSAGVKTSLPWLQRIMKSKIRFNRAMAKLRDYSLVDTVPKTASYRFHLCLHDWLSKSGPPSIQSFLAAGQCLNESIGDRLDSTYWTASHRVLPHSLQLAGARFDALWDLADEHGELAVLGKCLGDLFSSWDKFAQAENMYRRALAQSEKTAGPTALATLNTANNLGLLCYTQGRNDEAEQLFTRALAGYEQAVGPDHRSSLNTINNLGLVYKNQGKLDEAENMNLRALAGKRRTLGTDHILTYDTVYNLGIVYRLQGKLQDSERMYVCCLAGYEKKLGPDHISTLDALQSLGTLYRIQGRFEEAEQIYTRSMAGYERVVGFDQNKTVIAFEQLGSLYYTQGKLIEAKQMYSKILALPDKDVEEAYVKQAVHWTTIILLKAMTESADVEIAQLYYGQLIHHLQSWSRCLDVDTDLLSHRLSQLNNHSLQLVLLQASCSTIHAAAVLASNECGTCQLSLSLDTGFHACRQCNAVLRCSNCADKLIDDHRLLDIGQVVFLIQEILKGGDVLDRSYGDKIFEF